MKLKNPNLKTLSMRNILLLTVLSVFTTLSSYGQCPDPPSVDNDQFFCSETAWLLIGETADYLSDMQVFPDQIGWTITWYEDNAGVPGPVVANPGAELLVNGAVYHVTQTDTANCESDPLMITFTERDCACIKDPTFEDQDGNSTNRGYTYTSLGIADGKTCGQGPMNASPPITVGVTNAMTTGNKAVFVTPGADPTANVNITRTTPNNPSSSHGFRLGRNASSPATVTSMQKYFIAGEVFVFDFAMVLQNPTSPVHLYEEMPFAQVNLYDQNNNLVRSRCIVSDMSDCIFNTPTQTFYTDWSCMKLNTFEYQGEPLRAEFYVSDCQLGGHYGYIYIDDIYVGNDREDLCGSSAFGYALVENIQPTGEYCFITDNTSTSNACGFGGNFNNIPGFPLEVCGIYDIPLSQGQPPRLDDLTLDIIQNDVVVGSVSNWTPGSDPNSFCFTVNETDVNVVPYGEFTFALRIDFEMDCGDPYNFFVDDQTTASLCPRASCPLPLNVCDISGTGFSNFNLRQVESDILGLRWQQGDILFSYFLNEQDAHDDTGAISDPTDFDNTIAGGQTIYIRLDWNIPSLGFDCYYIAELELSIDPLPDLTNLEDEYVVCTVPFSITLSGVPANLEDLGDVTYKWYRNGTQLATSSSYYDATSEGTYTVVVSNFECESSHDFEVVLIEYSVDLGGDQRVVCDGSPVTINADIVPGANTPPLDIDDFDFVWSTGETTQEITVTESGIYTVDVTYEGCTQTKTIEVLIGNPQVDLGAEIVLCELPAAGILLEPEVTGVPESEVAYEWSTGATTPTITVHDFGTYSVDIIWNGCVSTATKTIRQATAPEITLGDDFTKCADDPVTLEVIFLEDVEGALTYTWYLDGVSIAGDGPSIEVTDFGTYKVEVDNEGCIAEATVTIDAFAINPNCIITEGISPEGSPGFNDNLDLTFLAERTGIENLQIFNRYGMMVYEKTNYINEWEGQTTDGDKLPTGVYYYVLNMSGDDPVYGNQKAGWIYLNRGVN